MPPQIPEDGNFRPVASIRGLRGGHFAASFAALQASAPIPYARRDDGLLWAIAFAGSLLAAILIFVAVSLVMSFSEVLFHRPVDKSAAPSPSADAEASVTLSPDMFEKVPAKSGAEAAPAPPPRESAPDFARTSEDQRGKRPDKPAFIGERDTEATSDKAPDPNAKLMPSQKGIDPRDETDIETTESRYQDGRLDGGTPSPQPGEMSPPIPAAPPVSESPPVPPSPPIPETPASKPGETIADKASPEVPALKDLMQGPSPVDVPVSKPAPEKSLPPAPPAPPADKTAKVTPDQKPPAPAKPAAKPGDPAFSGFQRKTAIQGSISRTGRSALDVADSPLGRYQAAISRAVEQEWQRNCVRHRDFITPGFLTVRFFVLPDGKVKSVQFVGEMQTGEVQKGFTLNSIRDADIPAMPKEIRGDYKDESLELIFNFYF